MLPFKPLTYAMSKMTHIRYYLRVRAQQMFGVLSTIRYAANSICWDFISVIDSCACNDQCTANGACVDGNVVGSGTTCNCNCGFTGSTCATAISECCNFGPCENGGTCSTGNTGPFCQCASCFTGDLCQTRKRLFQNVYLVPL